MSAAINVNSHAIGSWHIALMFVDRYGWPSALSALLHFTVHTNDI